jgi:hypothetical protein
MAKKSSSSGSRRRRQRQLTQSERAQIVLIWSYLTQTARRELIDMLQGMMAVNPAPGGYDANSQAIPSPSPVQQERQNSVRQDTDVPAVRVEAVRPESRRLRIWERPLFRDVPQIRAYGNLSATERTLDRATNQAISIAAAMVARARRLDVSDDVLLNDLNSHWGDPETMRLMYIQPQGEPTIVGNLDMLTGREALLSQAQPQPPSTPHVSKSSSAHATSNKRSWASICETTPDSLVGSIEPPPSSSDSSDGGENPPREKKKKAKKKRRKLRPSPRPPPKGGGDDGPAPSSASIRA